MKTRYKAQPEFQLQKQICEYLRKVHPNVLFISDATSGSKLTSPQAIRNGLIQKDNFKIPDLQILEPNEKWHGLFLELKKETPYKKTGGLKKKLVTIYKIINKKRVAVGSYDHLELQNKSLELLRLKGYMSCFCWTYENAIEIIENHINNK